jgi:hypothetical protein
MGVALCSAVLLLTNLLHSSVRRPQASTMCQGEVCVADRHMAIHYMSQDPLHVQ